MSTTVARPSLLRKSTMDETIQEGLNFLNSGCRNYTGEPLLGRKRKSTSTTISHLRPRTPSPKRKPTAEPTSPTKKRKSPTRSPKRKTSPPSPSSSPASPKTSTRKASPRTTRKPRTISAPVSKRSYTPTPISTPPAPGCDWNSLDEFRRERKMKSTGVDTERLTEIIFTFDTTGSMGAAIGEAKKNIIEITNRLFDSVSNLRVGMIAHGDYCDPRKTIFQSTPLSNDKQQLISWINSVTNGGGGDWQENYEQVLEFANQHVSWTEGSHRVLVVIGDAIPHEPAECERQMKFYKLDNPRAIDWRTETDRCWEKGIKVYGVRANKSGTGKDVTDFFYESLAARTCGTNLQLQNFPMLTDMLLMVCFREADRGMFDNFRAEVQREGRMDDHRKEMFDRVAM